MSTRGFLRARARACMLFYELLICKHSLDADTTDVNDAGL